MRGKWVHTSPEISGSLTKVEDGVQRGKKRKLRTESNEERKKKKKKGLVFSIDLSSDKSMKNKRMRDE